MARTATVKALPETVLAEMTIKVREQKWGPTAIVNWLAEAGYQIGLQPIGRWYREQKARIEATETVVTAVYKAVSDGQSADVTIEVDLVAMLRGHLWTALEKMSPLDFADMPADKLINAIAKIEMVQLARRKLELELGATEALHLKRAEGSPDIDEATLVQVRQRIYGIFEPDASD
ncbi:MAG: hypothetical protein RLZZ511_4219 [Cyanobacteriota bacterium]|jgi:hypothetical protein